MAIRSFRNDATKDICYDRLTKASRLLLPRELHIKARIKLARLAAATNLNDLAELRGNRLESLKGERRGQFSIRINNQYRICFRWERNDAYEVEITDYH
jgi:toxin HigB-1